MLSKFYLDGRKEYFFRDITEIIKFLKITYCIWFAQIIP